MYQQVPADIASVFLGAIREVRSALESLRARGLSQESITRAREAVLETKRRTGEAVRAWSDRVSGDRSVIGEFEHDWRKGFKEVLVGCYLLSEKLDNHSEEAIRERDETLEALLASCGGLNRFAAEWHLNGARK